MLPVGLNECFLLVASVKMMAQSLRSRRTLITESIIDDKPTKNDTIQKKFARFIVQFSILGLIGIVIFYSVRCISIGLFFRPPSSSDGIWKSSLTSGDLSELENIYWTQPVISLDLIPTNIISTSPTAECEQMNSEWNMRSFARQEAITLVKEELDLDDAALQKIDDPMDLFKFVIMNKYGGFYMDQRAECKENIDEWIQFYYPTKQIHFNNYILSYQLLNNEQQMEKKYVDLDMIVAFESSDPFEFANWSFFSKPNNPILQFIIDSYLDYIEHGDFDNAIDKDVKARNEGVEYVGPHVFTEAIVGFIDTFTNDREQALSFHHFEAHKGHIITLYMGDDDDDDDREMDHVQNKEDMLNILVVSMPSYWQIARRKRPKPPA